MYTATFFHFSIQQNDPTLRCTPTKRDHVNSVHKYQSGRFAYQAGKTN